MSNKTLSNLAILLLMSGGFVIGIAPTWWKVLGYALSALGSIAIGTIRDRAEKAGVR